MEKEKKSNKSKIIIPVAIVIVILVVLGIVFFTGKMSKEKMLSVAEELNFTDFNKNVQENQTRAKETYSKNVYKVTGYVENIENDYIVLYDFDAQYGYSPKINAYLPKEDIKQIEKNQKITIIGKLDNIEYKTEPRMVGGMSYSTNYGTGEMKTAYLLEDTFEITGIATIPDLNYYFRSTTGKISVEKHEAKDWYCSIGSYDITEFGEERNFTENGASIIAGTTINNKDTVVLNGKILGYNLTNSTGHSTKYKITEIKSIAVKQAEN